MRLSAFKPVQVESMLKMVSVAAGLLILAGGAAAAVHPATPAQRTAPPAVDLQEASRRRPGDDGAGLHPVSRHRHGHQPEAQPRRMERGHPADDRGAGPLRLRGGLTEISAYLAEHFGREAPKPRLSLRRPIPSGIRSWPRQGRAERRDAAIVGVRAAADEGDLARRGVESSGIWRTG